MNRKFIVAVLSIVLLASCGKVVDKVNLVPYPQKVTVKCGSFDVVGATVRYSADVDSLTVALAERLAAQLTLATGEPSVLKKGRGCGVNLVLDKSLAAEEYRLHVGSWRVVIKASSLRGFNWGVQTLKQLMPAEIYGDVEAADVDWNVPCCKINDAPRFSYRGMHMDVSRHFFNVDAVKRYLDIM